MQHVIIAIHLMVVIALVALVLYQKSEGGALGIGSSGFMTGRGQANALTRATAILGTIFFLTSITLTILPAWERRAAGGDDWTKALDQKIELKEIKKQQDQAAPPPSDGKESIFDQLQRAQEQRQKSATPPATEPATAAPKVEAPKTDAPKAEVPKAETPAAEAPKGDVPAAASAPEAKPTPEPAVKAPEPPAASAPPMQVPETAIPVPAPAPAPQDAAPAASAPAPQGAAPTAPAEKPAETPAPPPPVIWKSPTQ
jgi:protein translocase SecG subunit